MMFFLQWLCVVYFTMLAIYVGATAHAGGMVGVIIAYLSTLVYVGLRSLFGRND